MHTMVGSLLQEPVAEVVRKLVSSRGSGTLEIHGLEEERRIHFVRGDIRGASSSRLRLGERLVAKGVVDPAARDRALDLVRKGLPLGQALVVTGAASGETVERELRELVSEIVVSSFSWRKGVYRFRASEDPLPPDRVLDVSTPSLVLIAIRELSGTGWMGSLLGDPETPFVFGPLAWDKLPGLALTADEAILASRLEDGVSVRSMSSELAMAEEAVVRFFYALFVLGILVPAPTRLESAGERRPSGPRPLPRRREPGQDGDEVAWRRRTIRSLHSRLSIETARDVLELSGGSSPSEVRESWRRLRYLFDPDLAMRPEYADLESELIEIRDRLDRACEGLLGSFGAKD